MTNALHSKGNSLSFLKESPVLKFKNIQEVIEYAWKEYSIAREEARSMLRTNYQDRHP
jgi:hypothetical protein